MNLSGRCSNLIALCNSKQASLVVGEAVGEILEVNGAISGPD